MTLYRRFWSPALERFVSLGGICLARNCLYQLADAILAFVHNFRRNVHRNATGYTFYQQHQKRVTILPARRRTQTRYILSPCMRFKCTDGRTIFDLSMKHAALGHTSLPAPLVHPPSTLFNTVGAQPDRKRNLSKLWGQVR